MFSNSVTLIPVFMQDMTKDQIANEKVALQKALLYYESIHGRPVCDALTFVSGVHYGSGIRHRRSVVTV
jgi:hypothetical protein